MSQSHLPRTGRGAVEVCAIDPPFPQEASFLLCGKTNHKGGLTMTTFVIFLTTIALVTFSFQVLCYLNSKSAMAYADRTVKRNRIEAAYQN